MEKESFHIRVPKRWARLSLVVVVTALIVAPLTAIASHSFSDVPNSNIFHADIEWLKDADVTKGCNPPSNTQFCPKDAVSREAMAAFMHRFARFLGAEDGTPALADHATTAGDADTVDGKHASDFLESGILVTTTGGNGWLAHNNAPSSTSRFVSGTVFFGDGDVVLSLAAPTQLGSSDYGLESFELCYILTGAGFIDRVSAFRTNDGSTSDTEILADTTDQTSTGCTTYTVNRAAGNGVGIFVALAGGGTVRLEGVKATWSLAANVTSAPQLTEGSENG